MLLRSILRLFSTPTAPKPIPTETSQSVVLYAQLPTAAPQGRSVPHCHAKIDGKHHTARRQSSGGHRQRLLSMRIEHIRICSPKRCERLAELGIITAGDLAAANPERLASHFTASRKALRVIQQYRRSIRFAASVPGMMPRDAMLLVSIHRRGVRGLACESAAALHRDLQRFAESSQGQAQLRGRRLPSTRRLKRWINECETITSNVSMRTRAA
ncbi:hypothetical protein K227x_20240 [Rubripirellula lacrimiformis]|uniref:DUF4332 domain-containing protein n=1 Tax=Rubripirellula lacrimiformis TaxID=1930273 RepID=A0A517N922_9BACT|nr:DUF4332 domain-containing protein [Rubripirellula lacrimiformis]QDT03640.1 hypothetical protein K227x_20240 [Rubripirellula lacrimiformis]